MKGNQKALVVGLLLGLLAYHLLAKSGKVKTPLS